MTEPKIPPEALQPSGRTPESLPRGVGGSEPDASDDGGARPLTDDLPKVDNPIPPG